MPGLLMNLGMARYMAGKHAEAIAPLQRALAINPSLAPASLFLGGALLDSGRVQDAVAPLRKAVTALPDNPDARDMLARAYLGLSKFANATAQYRALTGLQPDNPRAWYGMARSYEGIAEATLTALQTASPDSPLLELIVADVAVTQEKFPAALAIYRRALDGTPLVGGLHESVADLYERAGAPGLGRHGARENQAPDGRLMRDAGGRVPLPGGARPRIAGRRARVADAGGPILDDPRGQPTGHRSRGAPRNTAPVSGASPHPRRDRAVAWAASRIGQGDARGAGPGSW